MVEPSKRKLWWRALSVQLAFALVLAVAAVTCGQIDSDSPPQGSETKEAAKPAKPAELPIDPRWKRLSQRKPIWIDAATKTVIVGGVICHREGPLEMFACPRNTKEHESVISVDCKAYVIHAALLAIGAKPGHPVTFQPSYQPATGDVIEIEVEWLNKTGQRQSARAQDWVKHLPTGKPMPYEWVFAGSAFWEDEETGKRRYYAEGGELICVSNFSTAMLDLPVKSSQDNVDLAFAAFAENIPEEGTLVRMRLRVKATAK